MKTVKVMLKDILPNPFKKDINDGQLDEEQVEKLVEGYEQTVFHENLLARPSPFKEGKFELVYGHHRLEAAKRVYGKDFEMSLHVVDFSDEQMLIDLCRENLVQGANFHTELHSVLLSKKWLEQSTVNSVYTTKDKSKGGYHTHQSQEIGSRQIADFLSKEGKAISHATVSNLLRIQEGLSPELLKKVKKHSTTADVDDTVTFKQALQLSSLEKAEQKPLLEAIKRDHQINGGRAHERIAQYKKAPEEIKQAVRKGEINLSDVDKVAVEKKSGVTVIAYQQLVSNFNKELASLGNRLGKEQYKKWVSHCSPLLRKMTCQLLTEVIREMEKMRSEFAIEGDTK